MLPVYITCRDRVADLRPLVAWLEQAGHDRITLLDNDSTWPPLLTYLEQTPHTVVRLRGNLGSQALWRAGLVPDEPFVLTDPDVVPTADCPDDAAAHLLELAERHGYAKAGLGLYLDDVPEDMPSLSWERSLVSPERECEPGVYASLIDTTFAVYGAHARFDLGALRCGAPYRARHLPWYRRELDEEHAYYVEHAHHGPEGTTSWPASRS